MAFENHQANFHEINPNWKEEQNRHLQALTTASQDPTNPSLPQLVEQVVAHYENYQAFKTRWAQEKNAPFEDSLAWIGGWRPMTAFRIINTRIGNLSTGQLSSLGQLQWTTNEEDRAITNLKAMHERLGMKSPKMIELSHELSKPDWENQFDDDDMQPTEEVFQKIFEKADELRLKTIKGIVRILSPIQAVLFLIAAMELQLMVHGLGKAEEECQINNVAAN